MNKFLVLLLVSFTANAQARNIDEGMRFNCAKISERVSVTFTPGTRAFFLEANGLRPKKDIGLTAELGLGVTGEFYQISAALPNCEVKNQALRCEARGAVLKVTDQSGDRFVKLERLIILSKLIESSSTTVKGTSVDHSTHVTIYASNESFSSGTEALSFDGTCEAQWQEK